MVLLITCILYDGPLSFKSVDAATQMNVTKLCFHVALLNAVQEDVLKVYF